MARVDPNAYGSGGGINVNANAGDLVSLFTGKSGSSTDTGTSTTQNSGAVTNTGSTTTSTSMSQDAMAAMLKTILEGTSGLAATAMGEHTAGLYNSTTNQMLVNDLLSRSAAQVAQNAKTSTTTQNTAATDTRGSVTSNNGTKTTVQNPSIKPSSAAKGAAVIGAIGLLPKGLRDAIGTKIAGAMGSGDTPTTTGNTPNAGSGVDTGNETSDTPSDSTSTTPDVSPNTTPVTTGGNTDWTPDAGSGVDSGADAYAGSGTDTVASYSGDGTDLNLGDFGAGTDYSSMGDVGDASSTIADAGDSIDWGSFFADGGSTENIFQRRAAALDSAEGAAVQGNDTNTAYQARIQQSSPQTTSAPAPAPARPSLVDSVRRVLKLAQGGLAYDDGGKVDLTNLGLLINPNAAKAPQGLAALNSPTDTTTDTSNVTGPTDSGTGFANTSNIAPVGKSASAGPQTTGGAVYTPVTQTPTATRTITRTSGVTSPAPAGESSTTSGTAQGGIDSSPHSVQSAAVSIGLSAIGLGILAPLINAIAPDTTATSGTATAADAAPSTTAAVGSVSVGNVSADDGIDGNVGTIGPTTSASVSGVDGDDSATSDSDGPAGNSTADGGNSSTDSGVSASSSDGSASASAGDGTGGDSFATGGNVTGPGDETSDSIPARLSNGEFVMNSEATARFRPWLEMLNNAFKAR